MSRVRGGLGVALALATIAAFSIPAVASSAATLPDVAVGGVSHRAVCTPGPAGTARCHAHVVTGRDGVTPRASALAPSGAYGPAQLRGAYELPSTTAGSGQTVAIVDAYAEPSIVTDL
ncbi:MAG: peptidase S8, partial [Actinobacteria bacterium]